MWHSVEKLKTGPFWMKQTSKWQWKVNENIVGAQDLNKWNFNGPASEIDGHWTPGYCTKFVLWYNFGVIIVQNGVQTFAGNFHN